jgi:transcriptional regulator with XRE-family HTH domain
MTTKQNHEAAEAAVRKAVGKRLAEVQAVLERQGLIRTAKDMADLLGVSDGALSDWKNGKNELPNGIARELRQRFGCGLDWLYVDVESTNTGDFNRDLYAVRKAGIAPRRGRPPKTPPERPFSIL